MKLIIKLVLCVMLIGTGGTVTVQAQDQNISIDPGFFRQQMINWAYTMQPSGELAEKIKALSVEQIQIYIETIDDPEEFLRSLDQVTTRQQNPQLFQTRPPQQDSGASQPGAIMKSLPAPSTTPFPPDYPPPTGAYKDTVIDAISGFGIGGADNTNRCSASDWADYVGVWWPLNTAFDALDGACVVAGCDPTGIACGIACGILETAKVALKIAAVPLEACDVHQGAIDGAEIEAAFENTKGLGADLTHIHDDLANHDGNLATHDADIKSAISTHDTEIKALLANIQAGVNANSDKLDLLLSRQLETIRLLHTPQGRRSTSVPACNGGPCSWPN